MSRLGSLAAGAGVGILVTVGVVFGFLTLGVMLGARLPIDFTTSLLVTAVALGLAVAIRTGLRMTGRAEAQD